MIGDSDAVSFDRLIDETETLDDLLDNGPGDDSATFLTAVQDAAKAIYETAQQLTVADVDAEFTDEEESDHD
jgi:hypothetical protein